MTAIRSRARLVATAWLVCQVATLCAFVPDDCCMPQSERANAAMTAKCHEHAPAAPAEGAACPMHQADGAACPMAGHSPGTDCGSMRQGCKGPEASLATLFAFMSDLADRPDSTVVMPWTPAATARPALLLSVPHATAAPPPKA